MHIFGIDFNGQKHFMYLELATERKKYYIILRLQNLRVFIYFRSACTTLLLNQPDHRRADQISNTRTVKKQRKNRTRSRSLATSLQSCVTLTLDSYDDIFSATALRDSDTSLMTSFSETVRNSGSWWWVSCVSGSSSRKPLPLEYPLESLYWPRHRTVLKQESFKAS